MTVGFSMSLLMAGPPAFQSLPVSETAHRADRREPLRHSASRACGRPALVHHRKVLPVVGVENQVVHVVLERMQQPDVRCEARSIASM
jgi:hypothetical protein